jgi:hypothetical protein
MTKNEVKTLGEGDDKLQWWAMVLFAEICEIVENERNGYTATELYPSIAQKTKEWERLVQGRMLEIAKQTLENQPSLEARVAKLEKQVARMA